MLMDIFLWGFIGFISVKEGSAISSPKTWTYEIKSIECTSSNTDLMNFNLINERVSRGVYALSGEFSLNFDIVDGDENQIAANSYRSALGDGDYKKLPMQLPSTQWIPFMNTHYKDIVMESLKDCSNLPYIEDKMELMAKNKYTLNKCQISQDGLPNHLQEGIYKIVISGTGIVDWQVEVIASVEQNV